MAGTYSDAPAPRFAYDRDGTQVLRVNLDTFVVEKEYSPAEIVEMNDEDTGGVQWYSFGGGSGANYQRHPLVFIFPESRNLTGYMLGASMIRNIDNGVEVSSDTTNGIDGSWVSIESPTVFGSTSSRGYWRDNINLVSASGFKALRFNQQANSNLGSTWNIYQIHLYGNIPGASSPDRLRIWHPTLDEPLDDATTADGSYLDWGDITRGTTADKSFRIKNNSGTLTANSVTISSEALSNTTPSLDGQITYSDGGSFATNINIGNLNPGAFSSVITIRRSTDLTASLSLWWLRTIVEAGSWS